MVEPHHVPPGACPYGDLYIYYLNGQVPGQVMSRAPGTYLGCWVEDEDSFLFFTAREDQAVEDWIDTALGQGADVALADSYCMPYDQWQQDADRVWQTPRLVIAAPWVEAHVTSGQKRLFLDPGVVFGSGTHPTTRHCLMALENYMAGFPDSRVLDLGCGTGILALAAAGLGAKSVLAVDLNPLCAQTAKKNVELNHLDNVVEVRCQDARKAANEPADLVMANIHFAVMERLLQDRAFSGNKYSILSGILRSEVGKVKNALGRSGARVLWEGHEENTWFTLMAQTKP